MCVWCVCVVVRVWGAWGVLGVGIASFGVDVDVFGLGLGERCGLGSRWGGGGIFEFFCCLFGVN